VVSRGPHMSSGGSGYAVICVDLIWHQPGFWGLTDPYIVVRLPALKQTDFKLGPVPYPGNVAARVNCFERL
jgi:hypothetical protein